MGIKKLGFLLAVVIVGATAAAAGEGSEAYVTLLYGDEFLLGVRVLGKSIRDTGSDKDMVVLASDGVSDFARRLLQADGWTVEIISLLTNPNQVRPKRLWGVYTKLKIFNMIKYKKVIYLDADTIVVKNVDDLFNCGKFCATLKHSERLNSGVMVVEPSEAVFNDMMSKINSLPSYTGGDQGFLNSYFADFANARLFEPNMPPELMKSRPVPEMERLSTIYNADVGLYMLANKWMVDEKELRIIHYTLGPLKPWDWWTSLVVKPVYMWQNIRDQLVESLPGTSGGTNPEEQLMIKILLILPVCILIFCSYRSNLQISKGFFSTFGQCSISFFAKKVYYRLKSGGGFIAYSGISVVTSPTVNSSQQIPNGIHSKIPPFLGAMSVVFCFMAAILSFALAFILVPFQVKPWMGLLLIYEWTFTTFFILFGSYLHAIHQWGNSSNNKGTVTTFEDESVKGHQRCTSSCDIVTWFYWTGMAFLAILIPSLPSLLGIKALFARLGLMVAGTLVLSSFMTCASEYLAIRAFIRGLEMA